MWPLATGAQQSLKKIPVVGVLWHAGSPEEEASYLTPLMAGLRELNYRPGENIIIENRFPAEQDEKFQRWPQNSLHSTRTFWSPSRPEPPWPCTRRRERSRLCS